MRGLIKPVLTDVYDYTQIPEAHELMAANKLKGTVSCLVGAPRRGLTNFAETIS